MDMIPPGGERPAAPSAEPRTSAYLEVIELKERVVALTGVAQECAQACHEVLLVVRQVADEHKAQGATQSAELLQTLHSVRKIVEQAPKAMVQIIDKRVASEASKWAKDVADVTAKTIDSHGTAVVQQVQGASRQAIEASTQVRRQLRPVSWAMLGAILVVGILLGSIGAGMVFSIRLQHTEALLESIVARQEAAPAVTATRGSAGGRRP